VSGSTADTIEPALANECARPAAYRVSVPTTASPVDAAARRPQP
jgi:hypothetical protein